MVNLRSVKAKKQGSQDIAGDKAGEQQFFGEGLCIFNNSCQEDLHRVRFFRSLDTVKLRIGLNYCIATGVFVWRD